MPTARSQLIDLNVTSFYHCYNRCVRQEYLFGVDEHGKDYTHRKQELTKQLHTLTACFGISVCAYAVMSNHYHIVLHVNKELVLSWSDTAITERWQKVARTKEIPTTERLLIWRERLYDLSWFMRFLNERMSRYCNKEDNKKGRFWESRFGSQALIDEGALLACMAYVDLNVIRAGQANTLIDSDFTSIKDRLQADETKQPEHLLPFQTPQIQETAESFTSSHHLKTNLPFTLSEYVSLVDWTGRQIREGKGYIVDNVPAIVATSGLNPKEWLHAVTQHNTSRRTIVGALAVVRDWAAAKGKTWWKGQREARQYYLTTA